MPVDYQDWIGLQVTDHWWMTRDGDDRARTIFDRHYSRTRYADGRKPKLFVGPGHKIVLLTERADALFVWRDFISGDQQRGVCCAVFRNEGFVQSSTLILEAEEMACMSSLLPHRFYTYVNPGAVQSANPGYCFKRAGWKRCGITARGLHILEKDPWPL